MVWLVASQPKTPESDILSRKGFHWHPEIVIYVKGEKQVIPANLGIGAAVHRSIHTHDSTGVLHLEKQGLVRKDDTKLGLFFKIWGRGINSFGTNVKMTVNGQENTEYENYQMQDNDKIELRFDMDTP